MVLGVCRRVLANAHDAEDAFQATFLVLVRKATTIRPAAMVGNWLYGVAHRTALEARRAAARRRVKEAQLALRTATPDDTLTDLRPVLDEELARLPGKYRAALVLCDLEGKTRKEAARQLGLPEGTVASRLGRARHILARRLTRRGVTLAAGVLAAALAEESASAALSFALVAATVKAATAYAAGTAAAATVVSATVAALTEGVVRAMLLNKLRIGTLLLAVVGVAGAGTGGVSYMARADEQPAAQSDRQIARADVQPSGPVQHAQAKAGQPGHVGTGAKTVTEKDQTKAALDALLKGYQAYRDANGKGKAAADQDLGKLLWDMMEKSYRPPPGKKAGPAGKAAMEQARQAFLTAFQIAYSLAKSNGKSAQHDRAAADQDLARVLAEMMAKSYRPSDGKRVGPMEKEAQDQQALLEASLTAFRIAYEVAWALGKDQTKMRPENVAALDAFVQAYERAKMLRKALAEQQARGGAGHEKTLEALDQFLKAGREFEQAVKRQAKARAVRQAKQEIESALGRVERATHDRRTELEVLDEIEKAVKDMKKAVQDKDNGK
jgi:RNA polymerase sigma factor (sigma-70 family)